VRTGFKTIPGLGSDTSTRIGDATRQIIVVAGADQASNANTITLWQREALDTEWYQVGEALTGRNGTNGWSPDHRAGDQRTPMGVFSLTAAGGRLPDPGTSLPYEYRPSYYQAGGGSGEDALAVELADGFDYVVAIDYNRLPGYPPSDPTRPMGSAAGGDIWLHVDHDSPTHGCVALDRAAMKMILGWLSPANRPLIVMGAAATLAL
jgi:L,D-peptidoglycan transpeptidase YkuD (ErfK/YbiS/YcfS/YnhG family)